MHLKMIFLLNVYTYKLINPTDIKHIDNNILLDSQFSGFYVFIYESKECFGHYLSKIVKENFKLIYANNESTLKFDKRAINYVYSVLCTALDILFKYDLKYILHIILNTDSLIINDDDTSHFSSLVIRCVYRIYNYCQEENNLYRRSNKDIPTKKFYLKKFAKILDPQDNHGLLIGLNFTVLRIVVDLINKLIDGNLSSFSFHEKIVKLEIAQICWDLYKTAETWRTLTSINIYKHVLNIEPMLCETFTGKNRFFLLRDGNIHSTLVSYKEHNFCIDQQEKSPFFNIPKLDHQIIYSHLPVLNLQECTNIINNESLIDNYTLEVCFTIYTFYNKIYQKNICIQVESTRRKKYKLKLKSISDGL